MEASALRVTKGGSTRVALVHRDDDELEHRSSLLKTSGYDVIALPRLVLPLAAALAGAELLLIDVRCLEGQTLIELVRDAYDVGGRCVVVLSSADPAQVDLIARAAGALGWISRRAHNEEFLAQVKAHLRHKQRFTGRNAPIASDVLDSLRRS